MLNARIDRGTEESAQETVSEMVAQEDWFKAQVQIGIDQIARGEFVEEEEMDAPVERLLQS